MSQTRARSRARRWLGALAYLAFLWLCVEVALQLFYRATAGDFLFSRATAPVWAPNPYSGVFNKPRLALHQRTQEFDTMVYTDAQGLRVPSPDASVSIDKPAGVYRIMLLGPSFAFGWGVNYEQSFAARLAEQLAEAGFAGSRKVEVVNAGVNSLPPPPQLEWYRHAGSRYRPDLVIQFIYGSMQFRIEREVHWRVDDEGYLVPLDASASAQLRAYAKNLATVFYAWILYTRLDAALAGDAAPHEVQGAGRTLTLEHDFDPAASDVAEVMAFYRDLAATVRESGSELLVVYFPLSYAIHAEDASRWRHLGVTDVEGQKKFDADFCGYLEKEAVPCIDATPELERAAAGGQRLYYWLDIHWTPKGNEVVARAVADRLLAHGSRGEASARPATLD